MANTPSTRRTRRRRPRSSELLERNQEIVRRVRNGEKVVDVAEDYDLSKWAIYKILPDDVERPGGQGDYPRERNERLRRQVMAMVADGMSYREVAQRLEISHTRVGQIVAEEREAVGEGD